MHTMPLLSMTNIKQPRNDHVAKFDKVYDLIVFADLY